MASAMMIYLSKRCKFLTGERDDLKQMVQNALIGRYKQYHLLKIATKLGMATDGYDPTVGEDDESDRP